MHNLTCTILASGRIWVSAIAAVAAIAWLGIGLWVRSRVAAVASLGSIGWVSAVAAKASICRWAAKACHALSCMKTTNCCIVTSPSSMGGGRLKFIAKKLAGWLKPKVLIKAVKPRCRS